MDDHLWVHVDDRGLSRVTEEIWIPYLDVDVIWTTEELDDNEEVLHGAVPVLELSPADVAALASEMADDSGRVLSMFSSLEEVVEAADFGLPPRRITIVHHQSESGVRVAPNVFLSTRDDAIIQSLIARGFQIVLQPLPNVTGRPWSGHQSGHLSGDAA